MSRVDVPVVADNGVAPPPQALRFHPLTFLSEGGEVLVGRPDTDSYGIFPDDGAALLDELRSGRSIDDASRWYLATYGEAPAIQEFVATLRELDFLRLDGDEGVEKGQAAPVRFQRLGRALFSPLAWVAFALLLVSALAVAVVHPRFFPHHENVFFSPYLAVIEVTVLVGQIPLVLLHELFHVLAGRRLGIRSSVRLGHRLHFLVFETVLDGLAAVPRRQRYLPMLAGTLADILAMSTLTLLAFLTREPDGSPTLAGAVCLALAFTTLPRILWQAYFFLRTDLYYLIVTVLGCVDLHTTARQLMTNRANRWLRRPHRIVDETEWHPRDRRAARWYGPLMVAGYAVAVGTTVLLVVPLAGRFLGDVVDRVLLQSGSSSVDVLDALALLILNAGQPLLALALARRDRIPKEIDQ